MPPAIKGDIEFEHVAFSYTDDAPVLTDVSFHIHPGQMVGVVGPTGGGKSTIVSLIPRFYDPTAGAVKIDGVDIRDYHCFALRDQIGYVLQETVLFEGTVRENIAYGRKGVTEEEIRRQQNWRTQTSSSRKCHTGTTRSWESGEKLCLADNASELELRAR